MDWTDERYERVAQVSQTPQLVGRSVSAAVRRSPYWVLVKRSWGRLEVLTTSLADGRRVLPVFSFEEEANLYLRLSARDTWRVRQTEVGELLSLLYCLCNRVELVALDPISDAEPDVTDRLVSLERKRFIDVFLRSTASVKGLPGCFSYCSSSRRSSQCLCLNQGRYVLEARG